MAARSQYRGVPYLKLIEITTGRIIEARGLLRLGRDPDATVALGGDDAGVVSATHAEIRHVDGAWRLFDMESRNGTFLNGLRLTADAPLRVGDQLSLGATGPVFSVAAVTDEIAPTIPEHSGVAPRVIPTDTRVYAVSLLEMRTGEHYEGRGTRIRLGRGRECEIRLDATPDLIVSRVHAEFTIGPAGGLVIRDAGSKHGTYVNGARLTRPLPVRLGDHLMLGDGGPTLVLEGVGTSPLRPVARRRRASTAFLKAVADEIGRDSRRGFRLVAALGVPLLPFDLGPHVHDRRYYFAGYRRPDSVRRHDYGGSSGSPLFNANGEVISIHRAGLPQAPGFALSVPLKHAIPLLPDPLRQRLGIQ